MLFARLREVRRKIAEQRRVPAYVILHDAALRSIARNAPSSIEELAAVRNVGRRRAADFGEAIFATIREHQSNR
jgi:ATP-dependent DNA helicase RecQ